MNDLERNTLALAFAEIASVAGAAIMDVYESGGEASVKADGSPVTAADLAAEAIILPQLNALLPDVLIVSEESGASENRDAKYFVLVDPLDGTREFIKRNGEFTVNIALIEDGVPIAGAVYAPALGKMYAGGAAGNGFDLRPGLPLASATARQPLTTRSYGVAGLAAAVSRSHLDPDTLWFLEHIPVADRVEAGSSLKFCRIAEAMIDVYPRFGPTMEWDTAAGHAVLSSAGGSVLSPFGGAFLYGKRGAGYRNGPFVAWGRGPL